jgi:hypothetical protein
MVHLQWIFFGLHNVAYIPHYQLVPLLSFNPPRIAAVEKLEGQLRRFSEIPSNIVVQDFRMISLELDIPSVVGQRKHGIKGISGACQIGVSIKEHEIVAVRCEV